MILYNCQGDTGYQLRKEVNEMTIKEVVEELKKYDENMEVRVLDDVYAEIVDDIEHIKERNNKEYILIQSVYGEE